jgi:hypothetical protein
MHFETTKAIIIASVKFDGWEVLLGAGLAILVIQHTVHGMPGYLTIVWIVLFALWVVMTFLVQLGIVPGKRSPKSAGQSGGASATGGTPASGKTG